MNSSAPYFDDYCQASELHEYNAAQFGEMVSSYVPEPRLRTLSTSAPDQALVRLADSLHEVAARRASVRAFADKPLPAEQVGALLQSFAIGIDGRRAYPSAGGLYPLEIVVALAHVDGFARQIAVYHADTHALGRIADLPSWEAWRQVLGSAVESEPPVTVFFCVHTEIACAKYGERGGRFALLEVGHAAQMLALRAAATGLGAYALGATMEQAASALFGFSGLDSAPTVVLAYACGVPMPEPESPGRWRGWPFRKRS